MTALHHNCRWLLSLIFKDNISNGCPPHSSPRLFIRSSHISRKNLDDCLMIWPQRRGPSKVNWTWRYSSSEFVLEHSGLIKHRQGTLQNDTQTGVLSFSTSYISLTMKITSFWNTQCLDRVFRSKKHSLFLHTCSLYADGFIYIVITINSIIYYGSVRVPEEGFQCTRSSGVVCLCVRETGCLYGLLPWHQH